MSAERTYRVIVSFMHSRRLGALIGDYTFDHDIRFEQAHTNGDGRYEMTGDLPASKALIMRDFVRFNEGFLFTSDLPMKETDRLRALTHA